MYYPKVIVLTLNYNGKSLLDDCITSYLANDYPNFEMVMIDNGSNDGSEEYVKATYPMVNCIQTGKNLGYSGGFKVGLKYAFENRKADFALITNNDVKVDSKVISALVEAALEDPLRGFVTGKVYYFDQPDTLQSVGKYEHPLRWNGDHIGAREIDEGQYNEPSERFFIDDIFTLVRRDVYEKLGGYDTTYFLQCEEYDWQARAKKAGYKFYYTPSAKIWHKESMTLGKWSPRKAYYDARNPLIVIMRYKEPAFFKRYFWWHTGCFVFLGSWSNAKHLRFKNAFKLWLGLFSAIRWGIVNKKLSWRHFI
ncbi:MAG: glycosyltransferase family 2 protein [Bacteroidales bacterium]|jgi:GT2 family glycosyltransferase